LLSLEYPNSGANAITCSGGFPNADWETNYFISLKLVSEVQSMEDRNKNKFKQSYPIPRVLTQEINNSESNDVNNNISENKSDGDPNLDVSLNEQSDK